MSVDTDLTDAAPALLRDDPDLTVYPDGEGFVPSSPAAPYVRWYSHTEWPKDADGNALDGLSVAATTRWYIHVVATNEYAAAEIAGQVRADLLDARPTVAGRSCGPIYMEASELTNRSELAGTPTYIRTVVYAMNSWPD